MKLVKARIRGLGTLAESRWFDPSPRLNLFQFPNPKYGRNFFRILQTINPSYAIKTVKPFADFPVFTEQGGYTRRVNPTKRTVALAVFGATPNLVKELVTVSDWLYETDRIEVGRRLDYSRWINFVELASSTRWSEISADMQTLLDQAQQLAPELAPPLAEILRTVQPADRVKDDLQDKLVQWLQNLPPAFINNSRQLIETTITAVMRADHFQAAYDIVRARLPLFVILDSSDPASISLPNLLQLVSEKAEFLGRKSTKAKQKFLNELNNQLEKSVFPGMMLRIDHPPAGLSLYFDGKPEQISLSSDGPLASLRQIQMKVSLAVAFSQVVYKTEPILLFTGPERTLPKTIHSKLADFVINVSKTCQCFYSFCDVDIFPDDVAARRYTAADLNMA